jgi:predicted RNase H-like HicB family nuclease
MQERLVRSFKAVIERDTATGLYVGRVPGFPGAHSQGASVEELKTNLREAIELLLEDGEPHRESELIVIQTVDVD